MFEQLIPAWEPAACFTLSVFALNLAMCSSPRCKPPLFVLLLLLVHRSFANSLRWPGELGNLWAISMGAWISHCTSLLFFEDRKRLVQSQFSNPRDEGLEAPSPTSLWNNPRLLGTKSCVPGVPKLETTSSRRSFALVRISKLVLLLAWQRYSALIFPGLLMPLRPADFSPTREIFFRRLLWPSASHTIITKHEVYLRAAFAVWWAVGAYTMLNTLHIAFSLLAVVILRRDNLSDWPPLFGDLSEGYSVRRFWGKFWHRLLVQPYTQCGRRLCKAIPGYRLEPATERVLTLFTIFGTSGAVHAAASWQMGDRCGWPRDILWFCGNFAAGMAEVIVVRRTRAIAQRIGCHDLLDRSSRGFLGKVVGYTWVFGFFFWSVPKWQYPKVYCKVLEELEGMQYTSEGAKVGVYR